MKVPHGIRVPEDGLLQVGVAHHVRDESQKECQRQEEGHDLGDASALVVGFFPLVTVLRRVRTAKG